MTSDHQTDVAIESGIDTHLDVNKIDCPRARGPFCSSRRGLMLHPTTRPLIPGKSCSFSTGFTFVELLIVVAIVSILAAIALPAYRNYVIRSEVAEGLSLLGDARVGVNEFYSRWGRMPADNGEAGLPPPDDMRGNFVRSIRVIEGGLVAAMDLGKDHDGQAIHRTLTFQPWVSAQSTSSPIVWSCGLQDPGLSDDYRTFGSAADNPVEDVWLPASCRATN